MSKSDNAKVEKTSKEAVSEAKTAKSAEPKDSTPASAKVAAETSAENNATISGTPNTPSAELVGPHQSADLSNAQHNQTGNVSPIPSPKLRLQAGPVAKSEIRLNGKTYKVGEHLPHDADFDELKELGAI